MRKEDQTPLPSMLPRKRRLSRGVYLVPSLLTAAGMFSGFYAMIYTFQSVLYNREDFKTAVWAIVIATFLDNLDGRLARLMKAESEFGFQFDSIADMVSFGVAPAVLVYGFSLIHLDRLGWIGAFFYLACAAIRLARFNVLSSEAPSRKYFKGLPSPVAAGGLAVTLLMAYQFLPTGFLNYGMLMVTFFLGLLMISNVRFRSLKDLDFRRYRIQSFLLVLGVLMLVFIFQEKTIFVMFIAYLCFGLIEELILFKRRRKSDPNVPFLPFGDR